ncbi:hypothetical protein Isop_3698 [Isosphaera pallida ATCC 43644]|uniref:Uncharacterized protein n=1 Tax=Isosphaera pallida (strain ATCC 43644 / DSM 9630 / IS1B) TaxID=575540 RepID=E8QZC5_ISOPI|nr:hypothetical protein [Isosphaera pallida]ADV64254.1 hypothetical protein Isop_3698 [Isosphaera pallida ATCC 43644]
MDHAPGRIATRGTSDSFHAHAVQLKDKAWLTSQRQNDSQAWKFAGTSDEEEARRAKSLRVAARMGRGRKRPLREAVLAKFTRHDDPQATGDSMIAKHAAKDADWNDGGTDAARIGLVTS